MKAKFKKTEMGIIPEGWEMSSLKQIAIFRNGKRSPERTISGKFPVYGSNGIIGLTNETNSEENTIVIGRVGAYCGNVYFSKSKSWITDNAIIGSAKDNNSSLFLFYLLKKLKLNEQRSGSSQPLINQSILNSLKVSIPTSEKEQKSIAKILFALDSKIDLNQIMNKTLEEISKTIFKHWFVDFEFPNKNGKPYLSSDGEMIYSDKLGKKIPREWTVQKIGDITTVRGGSTPDTTNARYWNDGNINWCTPKDLSDLDSLTLLDTERKITQDGLSVISSGLLPVGTILLSSRAPIGYLAISEIPVSINQGFIAIVCDKTISKFFMFFWLMNNLNIIKSRSHGTTFEEINKSNFREIDILVPTAETLASFETLIQQLYNKLVNNEREKIILSEIRDLLLTKLMSGRIRIQLESLQ